MATSPQPPVRPDERRRGAVHRGEERGPRGSVEDDIADPVEPGAGRAPRPRRPATHRHRRPAPTRGPRPRRRAPPPPRPPAAGRPPAPAPARGRRRGRTAGPRAGAARRCRRAGPARRRSPGTAPRCRRSRWPRRSSARAARPRSTADRAVTRPSWPWNGGLPITRSNEARHRPGSSPSATTTCSSTAASTPAAGPAERGPGDLHRQRIEVAPPAAGDRLRGVDARGHGGPDVGEQERTAAHRRVAHGGAPGGVAREGHDAVGDRRGGVVTAGPAAVGRVEERLEDAAREVGAEQLRRRRRHRDPAAGRRPGARAAQVGDRRRRPRHARSSSPPASDQAERTARR